jgi:hypothetical protein
MKYSAAGLIVKPTWDYNIKMTLYMMQPSKLIINPDTEFLSS